MARKILLADDSVTAQNMGRKILTDAGYEVVTVNNGSAALKKVTEAQPDLVVLDVYMPGYSGLEVCQRIKDSRETAHIPVLLTVGKLEPFKQDEARRVRADAFIIKPFEASELTAALAKLEGRMGVAPAPRKEERGSKPSTMDSFERTAAASGPQYGDQESGWKSRIKFPSPEKPIQSEPEPETYTAASSGAYRELITETPANTPPSSPATYRPLPAGIPQDITPDEIAAIAAAAARVKSGISAGSDLERLADDARLDKPEEQKESVAEELRPAKSEAVAASEPVVVAAAQPAVETTPVSDPASDSQALEAVSPVGVPEAAGENAQPVTTLSAAADTQGADSPENAPAQPASAPEDSEPVTVAAVGSAVAATIVQPAPLVMGSRWIAEEVPVEAAESMLVLEREMQKAYAAFAAAEHGHSFKSEPIDRDDEPMFATIAPPAIGVPVPVATHRAEQVEIKQSTPEDGTAPRATLASGGAPKPLQIPKPPAPCFVPAGPATEDSGHAVVAFGGPELMGESERDTKIASAQDTSSAPVESGAPALATSPAMPAEADKATTPTSMSQREPELAATTAAAWANWREVRDSVLGPKNAPEKPISANAAELEDFTKAKNLSKDDPAPSAQPEVAKAAAASAESAGISDPNLSSIVDTMLAELKPKLMAELAEKLKKEKKNK